jgi:hypothetical protein
VRLRWRWAGNVLVRIGEAPVDPHGTDPLRGQNLSVGLDFRKMSASTGMSGRLSRVFLEDLLNSGLLS